LLLCDTYSVNFVQWHRSATNKRAAKRSVLTKLNVRVCVFKWNKWLTYNLARVPSIINLQYFYPTSDVSLELCNTNCFFRSPSTISQKLKIVINIEVRLD
jgi:hypothetical protein